jgi:hypothetical protein
MSDYKALIEAYSDACLEYRPDAQWGPAFEARTALTEYIESLQKQLAEASASLEEARAYGQHKGFCPSWPFSSFYNTSSTCTCGYKAALQQ